MAPDDRQLSQTKTRVDAEGPARAPWWRWWPLLAVAAVVWAWFGYGADVMYAAVVAGVAVYACGGALERGRSGVRASLESVAWSGGALLAGFAFGAVTGWGPADRVTQGIWGFVAGLALVAVVLVIRTRWRSSGHESRDEGPTPGV